MQIHTLPGGGGRVDQSYATFSPVHSMGNDSAVSSERLLLQTAKQQHSRNLRATFNPRRASGSKQATWPVQPGAV